MKIIRFFFIQALKFIALTMTAIATSLYVNIPQENYEASKPKVSVPNWDYTQRNN